MWHAALRSVLTRAVKMGRLDVTWPDGQTETLGGGPGAPEVAISIDAPALRPLCLRPVLSLGEAYMENDQTDLAIRFYRKSLELDPGNENARAMIARMGG